MKSRYAIKINFLLLLFSFSYVTVHSQSAGKPNILFIVVDDLRPELNCYNAEYIHSPNIDRLAKQGTMFERAYCNVPVCGASRASLLTGLRPTRNRFLHYETRAETDAPGVTTLPSHFKNNGYHTISNGKVFHHADDSEESWDENWLPSSVSNSWQDYLLPKNIKAQNKKKWGGPSFERADVDDNAYMDGKVAEKVIEDLEKLSKQDQPFFLAAGFLKPHLPFNAPEKYWELYDGKVTLPENNYPPENAPKESFHKFWELRAYSGIPLFGAINDKKAKELIHGYYACVSYTDAQVGKILNELERLELDKNTIVILCGDHGWNLREHGLWCKTASYETSLHSPLILMVPGHNQVKTTKEIVEFVDIYPSLCELTNLELPEHLQGNSFKELLFNTDASSDGVAICQWNEGTTVIRDNYFYTEWINSEDSTYARMLYDHDRDSAENINISEHLENKIIIQNLKKEMPQERAD
jgi:iduronate 2-sulfatase